MASTFHSTSPLKGFSLCLFLRLGSRALLHKSVSFSSHTPAGLVRATDTPKPPARRSPYPLPSTKELHLRILGEGHREKTNWQACIRLQGFSIQEAETTNIQQHPCMQTIPYPFDTDLFLRNRGAIVAMPKHKQMLVTNCEDSQARRIVINFRVHIRFPNQPHPINWLISLVLGDSSWAQSRTMLGRHGGIKSQLPWGGMDLKRSHLAVAHFQIFFYLC